MNHRVPAFDPWARNTRNRRARALVRDVHDVDPGLQLEELHAQVMVRAVV